MNDDDYPNEDDYRAECDAHILDTLANPLPLPSAFDERLALAHHRQAARHRAAAALEMSAEPKRRSGFEGVTREQQKQLLEFFMHRLGTAKCDCRQELATTLPQAYNAWFGWEVVHISSAVSNPEGTWYEQQQKTTA